MPERPTDSLPPDDPTLTPPAPLSEVTPYAETLVPPGEAAASSTAPPSGGPHTRPVEGASGPVWPQIPGHEILGELGRGGMGVVYKARHLGLKRLVAVKMILAGEFAAPAQRQRFLHESQAVARFQHPNIVQVHDSGEAASRPYFSLEYVGGGSLDRKLGGTPQPPRQAAALVETLARAMQYAHEHGIVHRDLKPANVLLTEDDTPKVTDFGLAKRLGAEGLSADGDVMGTPSYMAPEQASGKAREVGPGADVYALGAILYELLTGRPPFKGATLLETLEQVRSQEPVSPARLQPKAPRDLVTVCLRCLEKEPGRRYASAGELADDLRRFQGGEPVRARPTPAWERGWKWARRRPAVASLAAACLLATALGFAGVSWKWREAAAARDAEEGARLRAEGAEQDARRAQEEEGRQRRQAQEALADSRASLYARNLAFAEREYADGRPDRAAERLDECPPELRRWEWHFLKRRLTAGRTAFRADEHHVDCLAYSPDGRLLATGGGNPLISDGPADVKLWDAATGRLLLALDGATKEKPGGHTGLVTGLAFSPDGRWLASASMRLDVAKIFKTGSLSAAPLDGEVKVWDAAAGKLVRTLRGLGGVAFSPDGRLLVAGTADGRTAVWDAATGAEASEPLPARRGSATQFAFSPDGKALAVRYWGLSAKAGGLPEVTGGLTVWDLPGRRPLFSREGLQSQGGVAFSPDGGRLAAAADQEVKVLDARDGREILGLRGHGTKVGSVAFSPDGRLLASAGGQIVKVWDATTGKELHTLRGHSGGVEALAFAPTRDGPARRLASAGDDATVNLWDLSAAPDGRTLAGHDKTGMLTAVAFSPDGRLVAEANGDGPLVNVWDVAAGRVVRRITGHSVLSLAFSPDGRLLALAAGNPTRTGRPGELLLYDLADDQAPPRALDGHTRFVVCVAFSRDGTLLASASADARGRQAGEVLVWDVASSRVRCRPRCAEIVTGLALSSDGRRLAVASGAAPVRLYDTADGAEAKVLAGGPADYNRVAFGPGGGLLAAGTDDGMVAVWDADGGRQVLGFRAHAGAVMGLAFTPDGDRMATASFGLKSGRGELKLWDTHSGRELLTLPGQSAVAFSPDGRLLAAPTTSELTRPGTVTVWDATPSPEIFSLRPAAGDVNAVAYGRDGRHLASGHSDGSVALWDAETGRHLRTFPAHKSFITRVALSPDGRLLATASNDKTVKLWDPEGVALRELVGHTDRVWGAAFSPDGRFIASASKDKTARLWDAESGKELRRLDHPHIVFGVAFSPDGKLLATACMDKAVRVWDAATGKEVRRLDGHAAGVTRVAFSPDGTRLASAGVDRTVKLWDVANGRELEMAGGPGLPNLPTASAVLAGAVGPDALLRAACALNAARPPVHSGTIHGLAFSPDGRYLATGGNDRAARIWDLAGGAGPTALEGHAHTVFDVTFSPNGRRLATASFDGTLKVWRAGPAGGSSR
jgi:WD40 repeat protein